MLKRFFIKSIFPQKEERAEKSDRVMGYYTDLFKALPKYASVSDAIKAQIALGNRRFFENQKHIFKDKFIENSFLPDVAWFHEIAHLAGLFPHTPFGEEFAMIAEQGALKSMQPINQTIQRSRDITLYRIAVGADHLDGIYRSNNMIKNRKIKDWQAIYASALGTWVKEKFSEYYQGDHVLSYSKKDRQRIALALQDKASTNPELFNKHILKQHDTELPVELLCLSKTERKILLFIARVGFEQYAQRQVVNPLPSDIEHLRPRIERTLAHLHRRICCNPKANKELQINYLDVA